MPAYQISTTFSESRVIDFTRRSHLSKRYVLIYNKRVIKESLHSPHSEKIKTITAIHASVFICRVKVIHPFGLRGTAKELFGECKPTMAGTYKKSSLLV